MTVRRTTTTGFTVSEGLACRRLNAVEALRSPGENVREDIHRCEACGKEFDTEAELEEHVQEVGLAE